ncbi:hypothetical protein K0M31_003083 [Melipona bicolor]|uniref:Uncharacterized protein n=1 Tax=Melipona bicolor TaxID=60889 RepID=A0AA40KQ54_9HYME|nr:hypothetical protein K0M31_003083 [Melipona bicolor]
MERRVRVERIEREREEEDVELRRMSARWTSHLAISSLVTVASTGGGCTSLQPAACASRVVAVAAVAPPAATQYTPPVLLVALPARNPPSETIPDSVPAGQPTFRWLLINASFAALATMNPNSLPLLLSLSLSLLLLP